MTEMQYAEEALKDSREFMHTMMMIKWILLSMSIAIWGMIVYFLLQEIPKWWKSFNKKGFRGPHAAGESLIKN